MVIKIHKNGSYERISQESRKNGSCENLSSAKNTEKTEPILTSQQIENIPPENSLTANVTDTKTPVNYKIILGSLAGVGILLLIAKKFIKL